MEGLTPKQKFFCEEYVKDWNATRAMTVAGYSPKTAAEQGTRMLKDVNIQNYIQQIKEEKTRQANIEIYEIIMKLKEIIDDNTVKTKDKLTALDMLAKYLKMYENKVEVNNNITVKLPEGFDSNGN